MPIDTPADVQVDAPVDAIGQTHPRAGPAARIVSLVPSITELLFTLGLGASVVGRTGFCIHPRASVRAVPKLGGTKDVDLSSLQALAPSHVIVNIDENTRETYDELCTFVPHVVVTHPKAPRDNLALYRLLGILFSRESEAEALCTRFESALERAAAAKLPARRVLYVIWRDPWMTITPDTYIAATLELVNWQCVAARRSGRYPEFEDDEVATMQADLVLLSSEPYPFRDKHLSEAARLTGGTGDVRLIDGEMVSWYGSRAIAGIDYLVDYATTLEPQTT